MSVTLDLEARVRHLCRAVEGAQVAREQGSSRAIRVTVPSERAAARLIEIAAREHLLASRGGAGWVRVEAVQA